MASFFNELHKAMKTIDNLDKFLTEKPKRPRTKYITKRFTEDELFYLLQQLERVADFEHSDYERKINNNLRKKLNNQ